MPVGRLVEFRHEHRRQVLQAVLGLDSGEMAAVADQLIGHLVDDEGGVVVRGEGIVGAAEQFALLFRLQDAEGDSGDDVVAMGEAALEEFLGERSGIAVENRNPGIAPELTFQVLGKFGVEFEQYDPGIRVHAADDLPGMAAFARSILDDDPRLAEVHLPAHLADQGAGTGNYGSDLEGTLQESLEENGAHSGALGKEAATICVEFKNVQHLEFFRRESAFRERHLTYSVSLILRSSLSLALFIFVSIVLGLLSEPLPRVR
jgi:hypothetical protein